MAEEPQGLLDDDPALDCILSNEMLKEERNSQKKPSGGCLGLLAVIVLPAGGMAYGLHRLLF